MKGAWSGFRVLAGGDGCCTMLNKVGWGKEEIQWNWFSMNTRRIICRSFVVGCLLFNHAMSENEVAVYSQEFVSEKISVVVEDLEGKTVQGDFQSIDAQGVLLRTQEGEKRIAADLLLKVVRSGVDRSEGELGGLIEVLGTDGTRLMVQGVEGKDKQWSLRLKDQQEAMLFRGEVESMKLRSLDTPSEAAWSSFRKDSRTADALIVVRPGGALDRIDGVVREIRGGKVSFDVDGQIVEAGFEKLAGILWYRKEGDRKGGTQGVYRVELLNGSQIVCSSMQRAGEMIEVQGAWEGVVAVPSQWLASIDCGQGKLALASSLEMLEVRNQSKLSFGAFDAVLSKSELPKWVMQRDGRRDLLFPGPGEVVIRVPDGMSKFRSRVERASESDLASAVKVEIWVDDQIAFRQDLGAGQQGMDIEANVQPNKRMRMQVVVGGKLKVGSRVLWREPRFSK